MNIISVVMYSDQCCGEYIMIFYVFVGAGYCFVLPYICSVLYHNNTM